MDSMTDFSCKVCYNSKNNKSFIAREMMFGMREEFLYFQCDSCNCLQIAEFPRDISKYYAAENYYSFVEYGLKKYQGLRGYLLRKKMVSSVLQDSVSKSIIKLSFSDVNTGYLSKVVKDINTRILDVGCGNGYKFLYPLYESGFRNISGCDPFIESNITYENGLTIFRNELSEISGERDVICFNHSFEHISNPLETLQKTNELLANGGYCIIRIPTSSSFAWKHYGVNWFQLDAPRHYFLHSIESIKYLADQTEFELEEYSFDSTHHQFTISERYKQDKIISERIYKSLWGRLLSIFQKLIYSIKARKLNSNMHGDQAIFYLRKK
jgi:SAM-dependent methyltransferase